MSHVCTPSIDIVTPFALKPRYPPPTQRHFIEIVVSDSVGRIWSSNQPWTPNTDFYAVDTNLAIGSSGQGDSEYYCLQHALHVTYLVLGFVTAAHN
jgi:hypothetical protein